MQCSARTIFILLHGEMRPTLLRFEIKLKNKNKKNKQTMKKKKQKHKKTYNNNKKTQHKMFVLKSKLHRRL